MNLRLREHFRRGNRDWQSQRIREFAVRLCFLERRNPVSKKSTKSKTKQKTSVPTQSITYAFLILSK